MPPSLWPTKNPQIPNHIQTNSLRQRPTYRVPLDTTRLLSTTLYFTQSLLSKRHHPVALDSKQIEPSKKQDYKPFPFSFDVVSMYTKIPLQDLMKSVNKIISNSPRNLLKHGDSLYSPKLISLMNIVFYNNCFQFNGNFYKQTHGIAMGTPCAWSTLDIFICDFMESAFKNFEGTKPVLYRQYRDDGFGIWNDSLDSFQSFFKFLNLLHPTIKFTYTIGQNKLHYLDLAIEIKDQNQILTETEYKPTDTFSYLHASSNHHKPCIDNILTSQKIRHIRNSTEEASAKFHIELCKHNLHKRGHSLSTFNKTAPDIKFKHRKKFLLYKINAFKNPRIRFITTYNHIQPDFSKTIRNNLALIPGGHITAIGGPPMLAFRTLKSLKDHIVRAEYPAPDK